MATKPTRTKKPVASKVATDQPNTPPEQPTGAVDNPLPDVPVAESITDDLEQPWLAGDPDNHDDIDDEIDSNEVIDLIKVHRDEPQHEGGPLEADVHLDEIDSYLAAGWVR